MSIQLTSAGKTLLEENPNLTITKLVLGSAFGYSPSSNPSGLQGSELYVQSNQWTPIAANTNTNKYIFDIPSTQADITFGEFALYAGNTLFAVAGLINASVKQAQKTQRFEVFVSLDSSHVASLEQSVVYSTESFPRVASVDSLPRPRDTVRNVFNVYMTPSKAFLAYADPNGIWTFDTKRSVKYSGKINTIGTYGFQSNDLVDNQFSGDISEIVVQFITGEQRGLCRSISLLSSFGSVTWTTPVPDDFLPKVGDSFNILGPTPSSGGGGLGPTGPQGVTGPTGPSGSSSGSLALFGPLSANDSGSVTLDQSNLSKINILPPSDFSWILPNADTLPVGTQIGFVYDKSLPYTGTGSITAPNFAQISNGGLQFKLNDFWRTFSEQYNLFRLSDMDEVIFQLVEITQGGFSTRYWMVASKIRNFSTPKSLYVGNTPIVELLDRKTTIYVNNPDDSITLGDSSNDAELTIKAAFYDTGGLLTKRQVSSDKIIGDFPWGTSKNLSLVPGDYLDLQYSKTSDSAGDWRVQRFSLSHYEKAFSLGKCLSRTGPSKTPVSSIGQPTLGLNLFGTNQDIVVTYPITKTNAELFYPAGSFSTYGTSDLTTWNGSGFPNLGTQWDCQEDGLYEFEINYKGWVGPKVKTAPGTTFTLVLSIQEPNGTFFSASWSTSGVMSNDRDNSDDSSKADTFISGVAKFSAYMSVGSYVLCMRAQSPTLGLFLELQASQNYAVRKIGPKASVST